MNLFKQGICKTDDLRYLLDTRSYRKSRQGIVPNYSIDFLGRAAARLLFGAPRAEQEKRAKATNHERFLSVSVSREGAFHCARGGSAPFSAADAST
jgi:hypothetical protein